MTEMNPTPTDIIDNDIPNTLTSVFCNEDESRSRLSVCNSCENFHIDTDAQTKCKACGCNISMLISFKDKNCPLEKW